MPDQYMTTGFALLDRALGGGLGKGDIFLLSAPAGEGKTNIAINMAISQARGGLRVVYVCTEESYQQIYKRVAASVSGISLPLMEKPTPEMKRKVKLSMRRVEQSNLRITGADTSGINEILEAMLVIPDGIDVLILDGLTALCSGPKAIGAVLIDALLASKKAAAQGNMAIVTTLTEWSSFKEPVLLGAVETVDYWMRIRRRPDTLTQHDVKIEKNRNGKNGTEFLAYIDGARCRTALNTGYWEASNNFVMKSGVS